MSIGSQNLTKGGTQNKEVTAIVDDASEAKRLRKLVNEEWVPESKLISFAMIADMEGEVKKLKKKFKDLKKQTDKINIDVDQNEIDRDERERNAEKSAISGQEILAEIQKRGSWFDQEDSRPFLKKYTSDRDFLHWQLGKEQLSLTKSQILLMSRI